MNGFCAQDIACKRGGRLLFEGFTLDLKAGDAALIAGPNGIGKSSLLRLLAGLAKADRGTLSLCGTIHDDDPEVYRAQLSYLGHLNAIKAPLSVQENLSFWAKGNSESALDAMDIADLAHTPARFLSAGQKRRLALARVIASQTKLWLLDEPASGLDQKSRDHLDKAITHHRDGGGMVIAVAHGDLHLPHAQGVDLRELAA